MRRFFVAKAWLGGAALAIGLAGMVSAVRALVWVAVGLAGVAFLLQFAERADER